MYFGGNLANDSTFYANFLFYHKRIIANQFLYSNANSILQSSPKFAPPSASVFDSISINLRGGVFFMSVTGQNGLIFDRDYADSTNI